MRTKAFILTLFVLARGFVFSQSREIDSLKLVLYSANDNFKKVDVLNNISILIRKYNYRNSLEYGERALSHAERIKYSHGIVFAYHNMGIAYANLSNFPESLKCFYTSLKLAEKTGDFKYAANDLQGIAVSYMRLNDTVKALESFQAALRIREKIADKGGVAQTYNSIGGLYLSQGKFDEALEKHFTALMICSATDFDGPEWSLPFCYSSIADVFRNEAEVADLSGKRDIAINKFNQAIEYFQKSIAICHKIERDASIADNYIEIGKAYRGLKKYNIARGYIEAGIKLFVKLDLIRFHYYAYLSLSAIDSIQGKYKQAFEHYKYYVLYKDSILNQEVLEKLENQNLQYEFEKKEDSLKQQQIITQTKLDSQQKLKNYYLGGSLMLGLLSLFVFLNFRNQKKVNELAGDAHSKEKAELELQSLRAQLNPHFMFNSLNAIQELILKEENEKSQSYLARFAKLLRMLLENADKPFIPLQKEIDFLQLYLSLENLRIPDLRYSIDVNKVIDTEQTMIPNMILQPYIENAIWHGLSHKEKDRLLQIRITQSNGTTQYEIEDNGVGRKKSAELKSLYRKEHRSKGMELLSKRFKLLAKEYGSDIKTEITDVMNNGEVNGTLVSISVPHSLTYQSLQKQ